MVPPLDPPARLVAVDALLPEQFLSELIVSGAERPRDRGHAVEHRGLGEVEVEEELQEGADLLVREPEHLERDDEEHQPQPEPLVAPSPDDVRYRGGDLSPAPAAVPPHHDVPGDDDPRGHDVLDDPRITVRVVLREDTTAPWTDGLVELDRRVDAVWPAPASAHVPSPPPPRIDLRTHTSRHDGGDRGLQRCQPLPQLRILSLELGATPPVVLELTFKRLAR